MDRFKQNWVILYNKYKKTIVDNLRNKIEYFNDNSTLKVFGRVISLTPVPIMKRLFWLFTLMVCFITASSVLKGALQIYSADAVSYSVATDYLEWDTAFPSVTLCELQDATKTKEFLAAQNLPASLGNFIKEVIYWNNKMCRACNNCKMNQTCVSDVEGLMKLMKAPCEEMLTDCFWNGEEYPCCEIFKPVTTEYGECFDFNSQFNDDEPLRYINRKNGLPNLTFTSHVSTLIKVHSPRNVISSISESVGPCSNLPLSSNLELILRAEETMTDVSVRSISKYSRDCLFDDELPDFVVNWPFKRYSYYACMWYCMAMDQYKACNCTKHFMPTIDLGDGIVPTCDLLGMKCLYKNRDEFSTDDCQCPMDCDEIDYQTVHVFCPRYERKEGDPEHRGTRGVVRVGQLPSLRIRRQAIRDMLGLVVDFGGVISVFFGASLLSFIEIFYIFCIRRNM